MKRTVSGWHLTDKKIRGVLDVLQVQDTLAKLRGYRLVEVPSQKLSIDVKEPLKTRLAGPIGCAKFRVGAKLWRDVRNFKIASAYNHIKHSLGAVFNI